VHASAEAHDTALNSLLGDPAGLGVRSMNHSVPFHRSASVTSTLLSRSDVPAATQSRDETHDIPWSPLSGAAPSRSGVGTVYQRPPYQVAARVTVMPEAVWANPAVVQLTGAAVHDTPNSLVHRAPLGAGTAAGRQ
jgi:hypothetical protein